MRQRSSGLNKMRQISWVAGNLLASQVGLCFMELDNVLWNDNNPLHYIKRSNCKNICISEILTTRTRYILHIIFKHSNCRISLKKFSLSADLENLRSYITLNINTILVKSHSKPLHTVHILRTHVVLSSNISFHTGLTGISWFSSALSDKSGTVRPLLLTLSQIKYSLITLPFDTLNPN
jgi:hypothetical protein